MLTPYEKAALDFVLTSYPDDLEYDQIIELIEQRHEDVEVWSVFENMFPEYIISNIENFQDALEVNFIAKDKNGNTCVDENAIREALSKVLKVINVDSDGDFFICKEASDIINEAEQLVQKI